MSKDRRSDMSKERNSSYLVINTDPNHPEVGQMMVLEGKSRKDVAERVLSADETDGDAIGWDPTPVEVQMFTLPAHAIEPSTFRVTRQTTSVVIEV